VDVWDRVDVGAEDVCWPFQGARNSKGYGQIRIGGRMVPAHRAAYEAATGAAPGELHVLHRCDNPPCCNPAHLFLGTAGDNVRDCAAKGRNRRGASHPGAKLTESQVAEIRRRSEAGEQGKTIAQIYDVTPQMVSMIIRRRNWTHV
jgi:hypothetical protein